jgi:ribosome-binding protein aMBF1 (putative translation factor)
MQKFILTICFALILVSFLDYPTSLEKLDRARQNEAAFIAPIGLQIRQARVQKNISQKALSKLSGLEKNQIEDIENGKVMPTKEVLMTIQQSLETEFLMDGYQ